MSVRQYGAILASSLALAGPAAAELAIPTQAFAGVEVVNPIPEETGPEQQTEYDAQMQQYCGALAASGGVKIVNGEKQGINGNKLDLSANDKKATLSGNIAVTKASEVDADCTPALYDATLLSVTTRAVEGTPTNNRVISSAVKFTLDAASGPESFSKTVTAKICKKGEKSRSIGTKSEYAVKLGNGTITNISAISDGFNKDKCAR